LAAKSQCWPATRVLQRTSLSAPQVTVDGDTAVAVNHSRVYLKDGAHRVRDVDLYAPDAPDIGSMRQFAEKRRARPLFDATVTAAVLDLQPTPLRRAWP
jgi:hypothetical protein